MKRFWDSLQKAKTWLIVGMVWHFYGILPMLIFMGVAMGVSSTAEPTFIGRLILYVTVVLYPGFYVMALIQGLLVGQSEFSLWHSVNNYTPPCCALMIPILFGGFEGYIFYLTFAGFKNIREKLRSRNISS